MDIYYYKSIEPFWGNWRIEEEIGEGAYGKVFLVSREEFGHKYTSAMKAITIPQTEGEWTSALMDGMDEMSVTSMFRSYVEEFVEEIATMSHFKGQSNIVSYEDHAVIEHANGHGWDILIRMELLTPLFTKISSEGPMTRDQIIKLGFDMCNVISLCSKSRMIHRDIKPENIFVSEHGDYKLGDFGIARQIEKTTGALSKKGTYSYMAPEVYMEKPYGASVDTYSLGIVLYWLLNRQRTPFLPIDKQVIGFSDRETALQRRMQGEQIPLPIDAQDALGEVILKACAYEPADRYQSAAEFSEALRQATAKGTEPVIPVRREAATGSDLGADQVSPAPAAEAMPQSAPPIIGGTNSGERELTFSLYGNTPKPPATSPEEPIYRKAASYDNSDMTAAGQSTTSTVQSATSVAQSTASTTQSTASTVQSVTSAVQSTASTTQSTAPAQNPPESSQQNATDVTKKKIDGVAIICSVFFSGIFILLGVFLLGIGVLAPGIILIGVGIGVMVLATKK